MVIADTCTTGHFVLPVTPVTNISPATTPLVINIPDGDNIQPTNACKLEIQWLPDEAKISHIVSSLVHSSLVSIIVLYDAGYKVVYYGHIFNVFFNKILLWKCIK